MTRILKAPPHHWKDKRVRKRYTTMYHATPKWLDEQQRADFYVVLREAKRLNANGFDVQVHHIVPLVSETVCGLNVPWNLQIVASKINNKIGNRYWPDMPGFIPDLFGDPFEIEPQQMRLALYAKKEHQA